MESSSTHTNAPLRVLIAEDDGVSRLRLETLLRTWGYDVSVATDGEEALRKLQEPGHPTLAVLDRMMPHRDGLDVCRAIRAIRSEPYVYIILLTGHDRQEDINEGLEAGADDYVVKPFQVQELRLRVRTGARIVGLQAELIAAREDLRFQAVHDSLTGILNRTGFIEAFQREKARARRQNAPVAVVMVDVDHFKGVNDVYGHIAGDAVLREIAKRLQSALRGSDVLGRYGGEEFVIAAAECGLEEGIALAERCRRAVSREPILAVKTAIKVTLSAGVAATTDIEEADYLFRLADEALYKAKQGGRNRVVASEPAGADVF